jgi:hypothetical protein
MVKNQPVSSIQDLRSIFIHSKELHVRLEDYVTPEKRDFRHQPYVIFSCSGNDSQTEERVNYFARFRLFPPAFMTFGNYSIGGPEATSLQMLIEAMAKATQQLVDKYFTNNGAIRRSHGLRYIMHTEEIRVKMRKTKQKA